MANRLKEKYLNEVVPACSKHCFEVADKADAV
ncbi:Uncharacterised protein [Streptococcus pneumoniae]|nr:Uncharacterised protein [Streptococcus pneumoniae]